jgi:dCTP diphosphatase
MSAPDPPADAISQLQAQLRDFTRARDWERFHTPKNLAMALAGEVGELLEIFQWLTPEQAASVMSSARADDVRDELADVLIYLARLADVLEVDLVEVARDKVERNDRRFPRDEVRGRADHRP